MDLFEARCLFRLDDQATEQTITARYREFARTHHPDMTDQQSATLDFTAINVAYELLRGDARKLASATIIDARTARLHEMLRRHTQPPQEGRLIDLYL